MITLSPEEFKKKYGQQALDQFDTKKEEGIFSEIKQAFQGGIDYAKQGIQEAAPVGGTDLVGGVGKILGGAAQAIGSPLAPVMNRTVNPAIDFAGKKIAEVGGKPFQDFSMSPAGEQTAKVAENVQNYAAGAGLVAGGIGGLKGAKTVATKTGAAVDSIPKPDLSGAPGYLASAARDVIPSRQGVIDSLLAKGLDLTPGDLTTIAQATTNEVGPWMAQNNLIGANKVATIGNINDFFQKNHFKTRAAIARDLKTYTPRMIPAYTTALKVMGENLDGVPGMAPVRGEITKLLEKTEIELSDVQRVKELMDDQLSLYNKMGDVKQNRQAQGLSNVRESLKTFIEKEAKIATGEDISLYNRNTQTARELLDAIENRSTRGLTRANVTWRDAMVGLGVYAFASPVVGLAAVVAYKLATSPTAMLRFARWLDKQGDAKRASINESFRKGEVPKDVQKVLDISEKDSISGQMGPESVSQQL